MADGAAPISHAQWEPPEDTGQPTTDGTIHYADVDPSIVGQPTEDPRPLPEGSQWPVML